MRNVWLWVLVAVVKTWEVTGWIAALVKVTIEASTRQTVTIPLKRQRCLINPANVNPSRHDEAETRIGLKFEPSFLVHASYCNAPTPN